MMTLDVGPTIHKGRIKVPTGFWFSSKEVSDRPNPGVIKVSVHTFNLEFGHVVRPRDPPKSSTLYETGGSTTEDERRT